MGKYINLNRKFVEISTDALKAKSDDNEDFVDQLGFGDGIEFEEFLNVERSILLSEAGTGKTTELKQIASTLYEQEKCAFFIRLENICNNKDIAFDVGSYGELESYIKNDCHGWVFLDSVDEAKLESPKKFRDAIKTISSIIKPALSRTCIIISSRTSMFKPSTDYDLCEECFCKYDVKAKNEDENDLDTKEKQGLQTEKNEENKFKIFKLKDLDNEQIRAFSKAQGLSNIDSFVEQIEENDFQEFARRPQDLNELVTYWSRHGRIDSKLKLIEFNVSKKLQEADENRAYLANISDEWLRKGAESIAAALILMKEQQILVTNNNSVSKGLNIENILIDWKPKDIETLLQRPIFDEAIYGTVRFHHRSVKEYLAARWFEKQLINGSSRHEVEKLFFKQIYGKEIAVPSMRSILPWLCLFDEGIRNKAVKIVPEIFLEGGDPSLIPVETKRKILEIICSRENNTSHFEFNLDRDAIKRFSTPELKGEIEEQLENQKDNTDIRFLLRLIIYGKLYGFINICSKFATNMSMDSHNRMLAIRAINLTGSKYEKENIRKQILINARPLSRSLLAEIIDGLLDSPNDVLWLIKAMQIVTKLDKYEVDLTDRVISEYLNKLSESNLEIALTQISRLVSKPPYLEHRVVGISKRHKWLLNAVVEPIKNLIKKDSKLCLDASFINLLTMISVIKRFDTYSTVGEIDELSSLVSNHKKLNYIHYWHTLNEIRNHDKNSSKNENISCHYPLFLGCFSKFTHDNFNDFLKEIETNANEYNKYTALHMVYNLYCENGRNPCDREAILNTINGNQDLLGHLNSWETHTITEQEREWEEQNRKWKIDEELRRAEQERIKLRNSEFFKKNYKELIKDSEKGEVTNQLLCLFDEIRAVNKINTSWSVTEWKTLIETECEEVAYAFRDALILFWKAAIPTLKSEQEDKNSTQYSTILSLSGIGIEANENPDWLNSIDNELAVKAVKFALGEMNGFPPWFEDLSRKFPKQAHDVTIKEIEWELSNDNTSGSYLLHDIFYHANWMWESLAEGLFEVLSKDNLTSNFDSISYSTRIIIQSGIVTPEKFAHFALLKIHECKDMQLLGNWLSLLISAEPAKGIKELKKQIEKQNDFSDKSRLVQFVVSGLTDGWRHSQKVYVFNNFKTPKVLKELYLIAHQFIRDEDDIDRVGKGTYSPNLRDYAQDARSAIFDELVKIGGHESYNMVIELSKTHPVEKYRFLMRISAKKIAEKDADISAFDEKRFNEFEKTLTLTPSNPKELYEHIIAKLIDIKIDFEEGDYSPFRLLISKNINEEIIRNFIGRELSQKSRNKYSLSQEDELADDKRPDLRIYGNGFNCTLPIEMKIADNWSGNELIEAMNNQLCKDYMMDTGTSHGIYLLIKKSKKTWVFGGKQINFEDFVVRLNQISTEGNYASSKGKPIKIIGIDLSKRKSI